MRTYRSTLEDDGVCNEEERSTTECEVTPLVTAADQSTDQPCHNHDLIDEDGIEDGGR